jgi:hypothetical protein
MSEEEKVPEVQSSINIKINPKAEEDGNDDD